MRVLVKPNGGRRLGALIVGLLMVGIGYPNATGAAVVATQSVTGAPAPTTTPAGHKGGTLSPRLLALSRTPAGGSAGPAGAGGRRRGAPGRGAVRAVSHAGRLPARRRTTDRPGGACDQHQRRLPPRHRRCRAG